MAGKTSKGAAQPKKGKGNARTALRELDPNVQLSRAGSSGGNTPDPPTAPRRSSRHAVKEAGFYAETPENPVVDSLPRPNVNARSRRPGVSLPTHRFVPDSDEDFPLESPPRDVVKGKGRPVPAVSDSDEDFPLSGGSDDDLDGLDDIYEKPILCPENSDVEEDHEYELSAQSDSEHQSEKDDPSDQSDSDFDQEETAPLSVKAEGKRPAPVKKVAGSRRAPKRAKRTNVNRRPPTPVVIAKQWLQQANKRSGIKPDDKDVLRFQDNMTQLVHRLSHIVRGAGAFHKVAEFLAKSTYNLFKSTDCDEICNAIFAHMPLQTQAILGKPDLQVKDLLRLPEAVTELGPSMGTYLDVLGKYSPSCIEIKPHPHCKFVNLDGVRTLKAFVAPASATEFGLYDGSASGMGGLRKRVGDHFLEMNRPDKKSSGVHYTLFGHHQDAVPNFRLTSIWDQEEDRRYPVLVEGLTMTYLGLQNEGEDGLHHPAATFEMNRKLRAGLSLPDFMSVSLNRAWPLYQGLGLTRDEMIEIAKRKKAKKEGCTNPGHNPGNKAVAYQVITTASGKKEWRCRTCLEFMKMNDGRDCSEEDWARATVCENPTHRPDKDATLQVITGNIAPGPRCFYCWRWFTYHQNDWPINKHGVDVNHKPVKLCENPNHPQDRDASYKVCHSGVVDSLRCGYCYTWIKDNQCDYPINKHGEDVTQKPVTVMVCKNPTHPEDKDAYLRVSKSPVMDGLRCGYCYSWALRNGCDYPIKKNGEDVTEDKPVTVKVCENPTHPGDKDAYDKVCNTVVADGLRCQFCRSWAHKHKSDYPIDMNGENVTLAEDKPATVKVCENPAHPEDQDAYLKVYNSRVVGGLRCHFCHYWAQQQKRDYPINKNGEDVTAS